MSIEQEVAEALTAAREASKRHRALCRRVEALETELKQARAECNGAGGAWSAMYDKVHELIMRGSE